LAVIKPGRRLKRESIRLRTILLKKRNSRLSREAISTHRLRTGRKLAPDDPRGGGKVPFRRQSFRNILGGKFSQTLNFGPWGWGRMKETGVGVGGGVRSSSQKGRRRVRECRKNENLELRLPAACWSLPKIVTRKGA